MPGRLLVRPRGTLAEGALAGRYARHGATPLRRIPRLGVDVVQVPPARADAALAALRADPDVVFAERDYIARAAYTPDDTYYATDQYGPQRIQADLAWDLCRGDTNVMVAVLDTGVETGHPDLHPNLAPGYDFVNRDTDPADDDGHGTHVAGICGAIADNATGVAGIGFNVRVMPLKVLNRRGQGSYSDIAEGLVYAADQGSDIANLSLSGSADSATLADAVAYAWAQGVLIVAAAGNDGDSAPEYPAAYPEVIAVAATDSNDVRASFSNFGDYVDVAAPGVGIFSTGRHPSPGFVTYATYSGTSQAAPHVAGLAALLLARNPALSNAQLRDGIERTADDLGAPGWDAYHGHGRVNAYQAVLWVTPSSLDEDGDFVSDAWEIVHLGGTSSVATADADLDGFDNLSEYVAGTDPNDPGDYLRLVVTAGVDGPVLSFTTRTAEGAGYQGSVRHYALEQSSDLADPDGWSAVPGHADHQGAGTVTAAVTPGPSPGFYRVRAWLTQDP